MTMLRDESDNSVIQSPQADKSVPWGRVQEKSALTNVLIFYTYTLFKVWLLAVISCEVC